MKTEQTTGNNPSGRMMKAISIEPYRPEWQPYFEQFNKAWIEKHFVLEAIDRHVLSNPETAILQKGGKILFAVYRDQVIGTVALMNSDGVTMELTKMAVEENHRGIGAGKLLCRAAIDLARDLGVKRLILFTQASLQPALTIYRKCGFKEVALEPGKYLRADTQLELKL